MFNLLFEGIGRVGKTKLINNLMSEMPGLWTYHKMPVPTSRSEGIEQFLQFYQHVNEATTPVIYDRSHISELVYSKLFRTYWTNDYRRFLFNLDRLLTKSTIPTVIVYVYPLWQSIMKPGGRVTDDLIRVPLEFYVTLTRSELPVVEITKHSHNAPVWREGNEVVADLLAALKEVSL